MNEVTFFYYQGRDWILISSYLDDSYFEVTRWATVQDTIDYPIEWAIYKQTRPADLVSPTPLHIQFYWQTVKIVASNAPILVPTLNIQQLAGEMKVSEALTVNSRNFIQSFLDAKTNEAINPPLLQFTQTNLQALLIDNAISVSERKFVQSFQQLFVIDPVQAPTLAFTQTTKTVELTQYNPNAIQVSMRPFRMASLPLALAHQPGDKVFDLSKYQTPRYIAMPPMVGGFRPLSVRYTGKSGGPLGSRTVSPAPVAA